MKYINKYNKFNEASNPKLEEELANSSAMNDILALSNIRPLYKITKNGFTFTRDLGAKTYVIIENGEYNVITRSQGLERIKIFKTLEECLRDVWAYVISKKVSGVIKKSNIYDKLIKDKLYQGERKSINDIINSEDPSIITDISNETNKLNELFRHIGIKFKDNVTNGVNNITVVIFFYMITSKYKDKEVNLISKYLSDKFGEDTDHVRLLKMDENILGDLNFTINKKNGITDRFNYQILVKSKEEIVPIVLDKFEKIIDGLSDTIFLKLKSYKNCKVKAPEIKQIIINYIKMIKESGYNIPDKKQVIEMMAKTIINHLTFKSLSKISKNNKDLWNALNKQAPNLGTAADMGEMGF